MSREMEDLEFFYFILFSERGSGKISLGLIRKSADFNIQ